MSTPIWPLLRFLFFSDILTLYFIPSFEDNISKYLDEVK